jgi:hypothetical protein
VAIELGSSGQFDVVVDGAIVAGRLQRGAPVGNGPDGFPPADEVVAYLRERLAVGGD